MCVCTLAFVRLRHSVTVSATPSRSLSLAHALFFHTQVGDDFYMNAGYNQWAEPNNIIVLYPQVIATPGDLSKNPQGCFDWWGYSGVDFAWKSGSQMGMVHNMVKHLSDPSVVLLKY
jgi:hypothetical protein